MHSVRRPFSATLAVSVLSVLPVALFAGILLTAFTGQWLGPAASTLLLPVGTIAVLIGFYVVLRRLSPLLRLAVSVAAFSIGCIALYPRATCAVQASMSEGC
jgi:hypothetical protein